MFIILKIIYETRAVLKIGGYIIAAIWRENMLAYLSADIICSEKRAVSYEEQIMKAIVFIMLQIYFATRAVLKIGAIFNN